MSNDAPENREGKLGAEDYRRKPRLPRANPEFARLVVSTREQLGLTQAQLSEAAAVSPRTLVQVEETGSARADVIIRLSAAMGKQPQDWLVRANHKVSEQRIRDVLTQQQQDSSTPFARIDPAVQFEKILERVKKHQGALMCSIVTSAVAIDRPDLMAPFEEMFKNRLCLAVVCPFPIADRVINTKRARLAEYYLGAYKWACLLGKQLRDFLPAHRSQIGVFFPAFRDNANLITPPLRISEVRPAFIKYRGSPELASQVELGAYLRFLDRRPDQWVQISNEQATERVEQAYSVWEDYCQDIIESWNPDGKESFFDDTKLVFWQRAADETR